MLIIGPSGSEKTNALLNLIQQDNNNLIDKIYLYTKDSEEPKYQLLIEKRKNAGIKNLNDPNAFIEYSNTVDCFTTNEWNENGGMNMSFKIEDEDVYLKYTEIWNEIKSMLNIKFHSQAIYDDKYIKQKKIQ